KIRKFHHFTPKFQKFIGNQFFVNFYYDWKNAQLDFRIRAGRFLARDVGARFEVTRYFCSGLRVTLWYTYTNGNDKINGRTYYDKGFSVSMPVDIFYTHTDRTRWGYGLSAWLRDVGAFSYTGRDIYYMIHDQRE